MSVPAQQPVNLLAYRPWTGRLAGPWSGVLAIARLGVAGLARRKLYWALYAFACLIFFSFFFGQYMLIWLEKQVGEEMVRAGPFPINPENFVRELRDTFKLNGSGATFRNLFFYEGMILTVALALAGAQIVGNDFRYRSLPFYLSKPMRGWHYVIGKCLAVSAVVNSMTTLPALVLLLEYGLLDSWGYFWTSRYLLLGILGYGVLLSVVLSLLLVAVTSLVKKTIPLVMVWGALFVFVPSVTLGLSVATESPWWRIVDIWNDAYIIGNRMLGEKLLDQPPVWAAAAFLTLVVVTSMLFLYWRIRAVEVV